MFGQGLFGERFFARLPIGSVASSCFRFVDCDSRLECSPALGSHRRTWPSSPQVKMASRESETRTSLTTSSPCPPDRVTISDATEDQLGDRPGDRRCGISRTLWPFEWFPTAINGEAARFSNFMAYSQSSCCRRSPTTKGLGSLRSRS